LKRKVNQYYIIT